MRKDRIAKAFALFMTLVIAGTTGCGGRKTSLNETGNKNVSTQKHLIFRKRMVSHQAAKYKTRKRNLWERRKNHL